MRTIATALWALFVSQVVPAAAEEPLSLDAAVNRALENAPQIIAQDAAVEAAQASSDGAGRLPDPELVAAIDNLPINTEDRFSFTRDFMTMRRIGVMQQFPNARKRHLQSERGTAGVMLAESERNLTRFEIAQAVADVSVSRTVAKELEARLSELLPTVELGERGARAALAAGRGSAADALTAEASVTALRDRILETEREAKVAEAALLRWIGEEARRPPSALAELRQQPLPPVEALESEASSKVSPT